jgi:GT2 family glycosyltransferase
VIGYGERDAGRFERTRHIEWASGAAIMVKREVFETVGDFETAYWMYYEEVDLCFRARRSNFRVVYVPDAVVYHRLSATIDKTLDTSGKEYHLQRSRILFVAKNWSVNVLLRWLPFELRLLTFRIIAVALHRSDSRTVLTLLRAYCWNLRNIPKIVHLRLKERSWGLAREQP